MRGDFLWLRPVRPRVRPLFIVAEMYLRTVRGRDISSTKVKALPESLGQCTLLEHLCVRAAAPPPCACPVVPALRCCAAAPGARLRHAASDAAASALALPVSAGPSPACACLQPAFDRARWGWVGAARRGCSVGAQVRGQHRARGASGGGRLAQPEVVVSAPAAALPRPADATRVAGGARTTRAPLGTCVCVHMCM